MKIKTLAAALVALAGVSAVPATSHAQSAPELAAAPLVVGHRGASGTRPEETIASYDHAVELGVDYIEGDLQLTSDGVLVMMHDTTLNRTARGDAANCTGAVSDHTLAQVKTCDVGSWFSPDYAGQRIVTLEELFQRYGKTVNYYIETKAPDQADHMEERLLDLLDKYDLRDASINNWQVLIQSFSSASLEKIHALDPRLPLVFLGAPRNDLQRTSGFAVGVGPSGTQTADYINTAHSLCLDVHPYTINTATQMQTLLNLGVDGMFTNYPDVLAGLLGDRKAHGLQGAIDAKNAHDACIARSKQAGVGGTVGATLSLTLGSPASFGAFTPGIAHVYDATTTASVVSSAGATALAVSDPSTTAPGRLLNGTFALTQPVLAAATSPVGKSAGPLAAVGSATSPTALLSYAAPVSNDTVTLQFRQSIAADDALRTGAYAKPLTFTLSTTTP